MTSIGSARRSGRFGPTSRSMLTGPSIPSPIPSAASSQFISSSSVRAYLTLPYLVTSIVSQYLANAVRACWGVIAFGSAFVPALYPIYADTGDTFRGGEDAQASCYRLFLSITPARYLLRVRFVDKPKLPRPPLVCLVHNLPRKQALRL